MPRGVDRYDEARLQARLWTPANDMARVQAWYDASALGTLACDSSGRILTWADKSGKGRNASHATPGDRPEFAANAWAKKRSMPVVRPESGGSDNFDVNIPQTSGMSAAVVVNRSTAASQKNLFGGLFGAPQLRIEADHTLFLIRALSAGLLQTAGIVPAGGSVVGFDASAAGNAVWIDGVAETNATNPSFGRQVDHLFLSSTDPYLDAASSVGEMVFYSVRLSRAERDRLDGYLAHKWGLVDGLTASHLYKRRPPLIGD